MKQEQVVLGLKYDQVISTLAALRMIVEQLELEEGGKLRKEYQSVYDVIDSQLIKQLGQEDE